MLENWLSPVSIKKIQRYKSLKKHQFGKNILIHQSQIPDLSKIQIALIGIDEKEADHTRSILYQYTFPFRNIRIADLGNIRKNEASFLIPLIKELLDSRIIPVLIAKDSSNILPQFLAYKSRETPINITIVAGQILFNGIRKKASNYLSRLLENEKKHLFHMSFLGGQAHFIPAPFLELVNDQGFDYSRLGILKSHPELAEPLVRDADMLGFDLNVLKSTDAPATSLPSPSGLTSEEACRISRYAGLSDKLSSIGFYGFRADLDSRQQTAHVMAQLIWYFMDGFANRKNDFPASTDGLVEYVVGLKTSSHEIRFWKSEKSGRWWMQVPGKKKKKYQRHHLVPCSYEDYQLACQDEIPDRLLNALKRFL